LTARHEVIELNRRLRELNEDLEVRITERTVELQRQATELEIANQELEAFSYSVSHDLRAPLRGMSGFARILAEDHAADLDEEGLRYLERIQVSASQMGELIDGLLAFFRLHRQRMAQEVLDMTELAGRAWASVCPDGAGVAWELAELPPAEGDRQLMNQVWVNLLENAVKFTRRTAGPRVAVSAAVQDGVVTYCVKDNGAGFEMKYAEKLFGPFQRLHRAEDFPGTGIGLALVHRIVRRHGGSITAIAAPNAGAEFRFTLGNNP
jgi:light-regulated signal transduction histidine kinase (bacteriophytochrome)